MRQRVIRLGPRGGRVVREHLGPDGRMRYEYDRPGGPAPTRQAAPEPLRPGGRPPAGPGAPHAPADFLRQIEDAARPHGYLLHRLTAPNGPPIAVLTRDEGNRGPRVLVAAGVHGDDRAGPQTLLALFQGTRPRLPGHGVFLPLVNAHGFERGTHGGADGDPLREPLRQAQAGVVLAVDRILPPLAAQVRLAVLVPTGGVAFLAALMLCARGTLMELVALVIRRAPPVQAPA